MQQAIDSVMTVILALLGIVMTAIGAVEAALRHAMTTAGLEPQVQSIVLVIAAVLLILAAFRLLGGLLAILVGVLLILLIVHIAAPGLDLPDLSGR